MEINNVPEIAVKLNKRGLLRDTDIIAVQSEGEIDIDDNILLAPDNPQTVGQQ